MSAIAAWRGLAHVRIALTAGRAGKESGKEGGQDKSACHECRKPLMRLAFSCAFGSVAGRVPEIVQGFQRTNMHSCDEPCND